MDKTNQISNLKSQISVSLKKIVKELTGDEIEPDVIIQTDLNKGDFSTNLAIVAFAGIKNPTFANAPAGKQESRIGSSIELAEEMVRLLSTTYEIPNSFRLIEAKPPGFINFWLAEKEISKHIDQTLKGFEASQSKNEIILEFGDPNPFKEPHIGHLRNLALGESLARLIESEAQKVIRTNYQGDVGLHVAKALYGLLQISNLKSQISNLEDEPLEKRVKALADSYTVGAKAFETDEEAKKEIISINNKIYKKDSEVMEIWEKGRKWSLDYFESLYKKLGTKYDKYYFESETEQVGLKIVKENTPRVFEKHDGALIFRADMYGLHTRVFVTKENYATYEGKDLGLAFLKNKDYPNATSIIMTANEQIDYFKVLLKALEKVDPKIANKTRHISFGFVNLKEGKMSSRTGNIVPAIWLLEETKKRLKKGFGEVSDEVLDDLSTGAVKWSMLKFSRESNISFSINESIDLAGNSGPYMQYTYARISSLLAKSSNVDFEANSVKSWEPELLALGRFICQFETHVKMASDNFSPNILCDFLYKLAQNFNGFYEKKKIIGSDSEKERIIISKAVGEVLKRGLNLLGIESPDKI